MRRHIYCTQPICIGGSSSQLPAPRSTALPDSPRSPHRVRREPAEGWSNLAKAILRPAPTARLGRHVNALPIHLEGQPIGEAVADLSIRPQGPHTRKNSQQNPVEIPWEQPDADPGRTSRPEPGQSAGFRRDRHPLDPPDEPAEPTRRACPHIRLGSSQCVPVEQRVADADTVMKPGIKPCPFPGGLGPGDSHCAQFSPFSLGKQLFSSIEINRRRVWGLRWQVHRGMLLAFRGIRSSCRLPAFGLQGPRGSIVGVADVESIRDWERRRRRQGDLFHAECEGRRRYGHRHLWSFRSDVDALRHEEMPRSGEHRQGSERAKAPAQSNLPCYHRSASPLDGDRLHPLGECGKCIAAVANGRAPNRSRVVWPRWFHRWCLPPWGRVRTWRRYRLNQPRAVRCPFWRVGILVGIGFDCDTFGKDVDIGWRWHVFGDSRIRGHNRLPRTGPLTAAGRKLSPSCQDAICPPLRSPSHFAGELLVCQIDECGEHRE